MTVISSVRPTSVRPDVSRKAREVSAAEAAAQVRSGMWLDWGFGLVQPDKFDAALAARKGELSSVKIRSCLSMRPRQILECDPTGDHFLSFNWHFSGYDRRQHDAGRCNYIPMNFGEAPDLYRRHVDRVDIACIKTAPMDEHGYFNFGGAVGYTKAMTERAGILLVETSERMPYVYGSEECVHVSEVHAVIEGDAAPMPEIPNPPVSDVDRKVAALIAPEIEDGTCLQIGIGGMPNAVCGLLRE